MDDMEVAWYNKALLDVQEIIGTMLDENARTIDNFEVHDALFILDRAVVKLYLPRDENETS